MADLGNVARNPSALQGINAVSGGVNQPLYEISGTAVVSGESADTVVRLLRNGSTVAVQHTLTDGQFRFPHCAAGLYEVMVFGKNRKRSKVFGPITVPAP